MRPWIILGLLIVGGALIFSCSQEPRVHIEVDTEKPPTPASSSETPTIQPALLQTEDRIVQPIDLPAIELTVQEKYDTALLDALNQLADKKYAEALAALEAARALRDTEQVQLEIEKVKRLQEQQAAAARAAQDIQTVLNQGKPEDANRLATDALQQFGATDVADDLTRIKRETTVVTAVQLGDDVTRRDRFRREGEAALRDNNLRAAAIAFETALQYGDQLELRNQLDQVRATLTRYDDARARALRLRRDPSQLEDALAALKDAAAAWDTLQVRQDLDECTLLLQKRRDRISVADFEVRGDLGVPMAGRAVAEELLPYFKVKYDPVERSQIGKVIDELRLEAGDLIDSPESRQQFAQLSRVRYMVVGSITPMSGILVNARLVDVRTGLVVQTARFVAAAPEELMGRLRQLATILMMTDEQKFAYEQKQTQQAALALKVIDVGTLPPPPLPMVVGQPLPPPIVVFAPQPPPLGGLVIDDFRRLPPPPPPDRGFSLDVAIGRDDPYRQRGFALSLELGDNLFRRGRYKEAHRQFELALRLGGGGVDLSLRIDRCRPHLPPPPPPPPPPSAVLVVQDPLAPPPVVVVAPPPRPRMVVFNFLVNADPGLVPPAFGDVASDHFASCFGATYDIVDRGEVSWYMGRLGITMRDVLTNAGARIALAQSLNVRFFAYGVIQQTASFNVSTHLIDAETGARHGGGDIHVQDHQELKLRMNELVKQTVAKPEQQAKLAQAGKENEKLLNDARKLYETGKYKEAADASREGLKRVPNSVAFQQLLQQSEQAAQKAALEESRKQEVARQRAAATAAQQKQQELAKQMEAARRKAEEDAKTKDAAARRAQEQQKLRAYGTLIAQAKQASQQGSHAQAVSLLQSAVALQPSDSVKRELALEKARDEEAKKTQAAKEQAAKEATLRKQREDELATAKAKVEEERKRREAEDAARRKDMETRDFAQAARLIEQAKQQLAKQQFDAALVALGTARQLHHTDEVDKLLAQASEAKAKADAEKKGAQAKAELERKLAEQKAQREKAEVDAKRKQEAYTAALTQAQKALMDKRYEEAEARYQEADKLFHTDAVISGLKQAQEGMARMHAQADAEKHKARAQKQADNDKQKRLAEEQKRAEAEKQKRLADEQKQADADKQKRMAAYQRAIKAGGDAMTVKHHDEAIKAFTEAGSLMPGDREAATLLRAAEKAKADAQAAADAEMRRKEGEQKRAADYSRLMKQAETAMGGKRYEEAAKAFGDALKLMPGDTAAAKGQRDALAMQREADKTKADAEARMQAEARKKEEEKKRQADFAKLMAQGQSAMTAKKFEDAVKAYTDALKLLPGDAAATRALNEANKALDAAKKPSAPQPKPATQQPAPQPKSVPPQLPAGYTRAMQNGAAADKQQKWADAVRWYKEALRLVPNDAKATTAQDFAQHMDNGQKAAANRKFTDAVKEYEAALKLVPNQPDATAALKRAKENKP
jgi:tetratricopeptide (TPR) repeat protein